ncbi:MAG: hypothetical protein ACTHN7_11100 [Solirubrobacterales bacterium]
MVENEGRFEGLSKWISEVSRWVRNDFARLERRIDYVDQRLEERMDRKFAHLEERIERR